MRVYCVMVDAGGAWEADCLYSVWSTREAAEAEAVRLNKKKRSDQSFSLGCYNGDAAVASVFVDAPREEWVDACTPTE